MMNGWLIISSVSSRQSLLGDFLSYCKNSNRPFVLLTSSRRLWRRGRQEHWNLARLGLFGSNPILFSALLPFMWLGSRLRFIAWIWKYKPSAIMLVHWPEKILFSRLASSRVNSLVWLEYPEQNPEHLPWLLRRLYNRAARYATVVTFSQQRVSELEKVQARKVVTVLPAVSGTIIRQDSIFKNLANRSERGRFVVGSVLYGLPKDQAERLLSAVAIAQTVCPIIELVIIGEGKNRRQIQWLARRMNMEKRVWLGGPASDFGKWLSHLDTYIIATEQPSLEDASWAISAMQAGLPVLGPEKEWLNTIITPKNGALLDINDAEVIARQLIKLQQDDEIRLAFGKEAKRQAIECSFDRFAQSMVKLLS